MSRDKNYQRLLNDKQWKLLRAAVFRRTNGLCEMCLKEGIYTPGVDVHHIRPVEQAKSVEGPDGMRARCYDPNNVMLLCIACHIKVHQDMRTHCKEKVKENKARARARFLEANDPNYGRDNERPQGKDVDSDDEGQRGLPSSDQHDNGRDGRPDEAMAFHRLDLTPI